jgi:hypothetical protein
MKTLTFLDFKTIIEHKKKANFKISDVIPKQMKKIQEKKVLMISFTKFNNKKWANNPTFTIIYHFQTLHKIHGVLNWMI